MKSSDGSVILEIGMDSSKAEKKLNQLNRKIASLQSSLEKKKAERSGMEESLSRAKRETTETYNEVLRLQNALKQSKAYTDSLAMRGPEWKASASYKQEMAFQKRTAAELKKQEALLVRRDALATKLNNKAEKLDQEIKEQTDSLEKQELTAGKLSRRLGAIYSQERLAGTLKSVSSNLGSGLAGLKKQAVKGGGAASNVLRSLFSAFGLRSLGNIRRGMDALTEGFNNGVRSILRYGVGVRSLFSLVSRLRGILTESFETLAQYDRQTNASISSVVSSLATLKNSLATAFAPIVNVAAPALAQLINMLATATNYVGMFFAALTGRSTYTKALGLQKEFAESLENTAGAAGSAAEAAKEAADQFSGLDEINRFDLNSEGVGGGGTGAAAETGPAFTTEEVALGNWAQEILDSIKAGAWADVANALSEKLDSAVASVDWAGLGQKAGYYLNGSLSVLAGVIAGFDWQALGTDLAAGFNNLVASVDWENIGVILAAQFSILVDGLGGLFETMDWSAVGFAVASALTGAINSINWAQAGRTLSQAAAGVLTALSTALGNVDWEQLGRNVASFFKSVDWQRVSDALFSALTAAINGLTNILVGLNWSGVLGDVGGAIKDTIINSIAATDFTAAWNVLKYLLDKAFFGENVANWWWSKGDYAGKDIVLGMINGLSDLEGGTINIFSGAYNAAVAEWDGTEAAFSQIEADAEAGLSGLPTRVRARFNRAYMDSKAAWTGTRRDFSQKAGEVDGSFATVPGDIKERFSSAFSKSKEAWSTSGREYAAIAMNIASAFTGIKSPIVAAFDIVRSGIVSSMSSARDAVKTAVDKMRSFFNFSWSFPSLKLPHISISGKFGLNPLQVPKCSIAWYAKGGIVDAATLFGGGSIVGEAGKEAIIPLERHTEWLDLVAGRLSDLLTNARNGMFDGVAGGLDNVAAAINRMTAALPNMEIAMPAMASGTVVPPGLFSGGEELGEVLSGLKDVLSGLRVGNDGGNRSYSFTAMLNRRELFREIIDEAKLQQGQTGKNPFEI